MKIKHKLHFFLALLLMLFPLSVYAYPQYVIPGGENIGIKVANNGVIVVGFYKVNNIDIAKDSNLMLGDVITKVNDTNITSIDEMISVLDKSDINNIKLTYKRGSNLYDTTLSVVANENGTYKTGIYVKDSILGIGSLSYIDISGNIPVYGALGHEIDEKNTAYKIEVKEGKIFASSVTGINKGTVGNPGSKSARFESDKVLGNIKSNTETGIYGTYSEKITDSQIEVGSSEDITLGPATIRTVIENNKKEDFEIEILNVDKNNKTKNILFKVTDEKLLNKTGGIVQGMSGSPILQNNKIIGAVTHVVVNDSTKGYGIFITTMLDEENN